MPLVNQAVTTILIVDDAPQNRDLADIVIHRELPAESDVQTIQAADGLDALHIVQAHHNSDHPISLIILDVEMPRKNGLELAHELKQLKLKIPIIFYSGSDSEITRESCLKLSPYFLKKPAKPIDLISMIHKVFKLAA